MKGPVSLLAVVFVTAAMVRPASGEIGELGERIAQQYKAEGARASRLPTRFLYEQEGTVVPLSPPADAKCVTIAMIAGRGLSFHAQFSGDVDDEDAAERASSAAGTLELSACGSLPTRVWLEADAGRGAVEIVVAYADAVLPSLRNRLPERLGGSVPQAVDPGALPALPPPERRADAAEARGRREGATLDPRRILASGTEGTGSARVDLAPGCHRIELFAPEPRNGGVRHRARLDVDAELRDEAKDEILARDRGDAPDAHLEACVGVRTSALVNFGGAPAVIDLQLTHARWAIPENLPEVFGPDGRARMTSALRSRAVTLPPDRPVVLATGVAGNTPVPFDVEPGACYVGIAAVVRGTARTFGLRAAVGERDAEDDRGSNGGAIVAFCSYDRSRAVVEVDLRGGSSGWGLAVFRVASGIWEARP